MHCSFRLWAYKPAVVAIAVMGLLTTVILLVQNLPSDFAVGTTALHAGIVASLSNGAALILFALAGCFALAYGLTLPIFLALCSASGTALAIAGFTIPVSIGGIALIVLGAGWLFSGRHLYSRQQITATGMLGAIFCGNTLIPLPHTQAFTETGAYLTGLFASQVIIALVAYQATFWLVWHLGEQANSKLRLAGLFACGIAVIFLSRAL